MVRKVIQIGDKILETKTKEVANIKSENVQSLVRDMLDTCLAKAEITAGLAAPQVGESLSIIICRRMDLEEETDKVISNDKLWEVMINPKITKASTKETAYWEGCLSVGEGMEGLWSPVSRPDDITITYKTPTDEAKTLRCRGFFAHVVQHEMDHLEGIVFLKYVKDPTLIWKAKKLDEYFDQYGEYPPTVDY